MDDLDIRCEQFVFQPAALFCSARCCLPSRYLGMFPASWMKSQPAAESDPQLAWTSLAITGWRYSRRTGRSARRSKSSYQIVARLDPYPFRVQRWESAARYRALTGLQRARLNAEVNDPPLVFPDSLARAGADLIASETRLYKSRRAQLCGFNGGTGRMRWSR